MKNLLIIFGLLTISSCSSFQMIDKYANNDMERFYHERGCFNMQVKLDVEQAYVSECATRGTPQAYITGFTLGIVDLSAAEYKFENALLAYLKDKYSLNDCKIYRTNVVEMMGDTQGVEVYYECESKTNS